ncbi:MAG TPA: hypothetical protein VJ898_05850 [Natrialbaceae archaeon]|nr:hypothetical protein [Natrialbaceae archaeon]
MASFWKTMAELGREKLDELGVVGTVLGAVWVLGILTWWDFMTGAYAENMAQPGQYYGIILAAWIVVGLAVYAWRDPHGIRSTDEASAAVDRGSESTSD